MAIDLEGDIRKWAIDILPYDRNDTTLCAEIAAKDARELLIVFHNWMFRHIQPVPRTVHLSGAFKANPITSHRKSDFDALIDKIETGQELKPNLSSRINTAIESHTKRLARRQDIDLMLLEWEVHHLHISNELQPNGFVKRDNPLLFAVFHPKDAYLLDVMTHHDFNRDHILKILANEWPRAALIHQLKDTPGQKIIGLAKKYDEEERNKLRRAGINTLVEIDGKVYKPAGGITTAGTSIRASMAADKIIASTKSLERALTNSPAQFQQYAQDHGLNWPNDPTFEFGLLEPSGLAFKELSTNLALTVA